MYVFMPKDEREDTRVSVKSLREEQTTRVKSKACENTTTIMTTLAFLRALFKTFFIRTYGMGLT